MSARYVWEKRNIKYLPDAKLVQTHSWYNNQAGTANHVLGYCCKNLQLSSDGKKYIPNGATTPLVFGTTVSCANYQYFIVSTSGSDWFASTVNTGSAYRYWWGSGGGALGIKSDTIFTANSTTSSATKFDFQVQTLVPSASTLIGSVSSASGSAYPTTSGGAVSGNYWYAYWGSDSIDPTGISYPTEKLRPGDKITVSITKSSSIKYGGTISYLYQYQLNGGSWTNIQTTSAESISFTVPSNAKTIRFRVRAQDDMGFVSTTYVTGDTAGVERLNLWVGINGKAKKGAELYVGVNGKARKVVAAYIGVNGKARRFL